MLETGQAADLAVLARRFKLTRARVTHISNYTLLAPDIQAEILAMPPIEPGRERMREPEMRAVVREVLWSEQRKRWRALIRSVPTRPRQPEDFSSSHTRPRDAVTVTLGATAWF